MQTISPDTIALIDGWAETRSGGLTPVHDVQDTAKYDTLVASMETDGWVGAPIVSDGDQAITGSHRYWAALATDTAVPRITVADLCECFDIDWNALRADHFDTIDAYIALAGELPADVVAYLGMDLH